MPSMRKLTVMCPIFTKHNTGGLILLLAALLLAACSSTSEKKTPLQTPTKASRVNNKIKHEFQQALVLMQARKLPQAAEKFHNLINHYPRMTGAWANLGLLYMKTGKWNKAKHALQQALSLNANSAPIYNYLGVIDRNLGLFQQARHAYKKAIDVDPAYASAWLNLGILYDIYMNKPAQALPQYEHYQQLKNHNDDKVHKWIVELKRRLAKQSNSSRATGDQHNG